MAGDGTVCRFVLVISVGGDEHAAHHREGAERGREHIAHDVAVVVLARPHHAAAAAHNARHAVVDKGVFVIYARFFEGVLIFFFVDVCEYRLETPVVYLAYGVLGSQPQIAFDGQRVIETGMRERGYRAVGVVHALEHACAVEIVYGIGGDRAVGSRYFEFRFRGSGYAHVGGFVHVAVCVTGDGYGLRPAGNVRRDAFHEYGSAEHRAVEYRSYRAVGRGIEAL